MHKSYQERLNHPADFRVKYRFYTEIEGGRKTLPYQGYRSDFWYKSREKEYPEMVFIIWPEFEDEQGNVILENECEIPSKGTARMWVINEERRDFHSNQIVVGLKGLFMEGSRKVAECEVIEVLGLVTNPRAK